MFEGFGTFFLKILGRRERTKEEKRMQDAPYFPILQSYSEMPRILNAIVYPSLMPGPYPESLTRNKCRLYGVVPVQGPPSNYREVGSHPSWTGYSRWDHQEPPGPL